MGNRTASGFHQPSASFVSQIRKHKQEEMKNLFSETRDHQQSETNEKKTETEFRPKSVKDFIISNPEFLDDFVSQHISQDRIRAWIRESKTVVLDGRTDTSADGKAFQTQTLERTLKQRQILGLTRNILIYPRKGMVEDVKELMEQLDFMEAPKDIESHLFPFTEVQPEEINLVFIYMVHQLLGKHAFPMSELCHFLTTLKVNYRDVEYNNYLHAFSHAQSMFWILRLHPGMFSEMEIKTLMIASISHAVNHFGSTEKYLRNIFQGLTNMYPYPILVNHHAETCFLILLDINNNMFCDIAIEEYETVLEEIYRCILSTSVENYRKQTDNLSTLLESEFDIKQKQTRDALKAAIMMVCELNDCWKPWQVHKYSVWSLYKEFFKQGDRELKLGMESAPQMMRMNVESIPKFQATYLQNFVIPILQVVAKALPKLKVVVQAASENLELWNTCT